MRTALVLFLISLLLVACGSRRRRSTRDGAAEGVDSSVTTDGGSIGTDADVSRRDSGSPGFDAGTPTSCDASEADATSTVGCNGGILGPSVAANALGGLCTPGTGDDFRGSCTAPNGICGVDTAASGICLQTCTPSSDSYVSRGDCPVGSRCFNLGDSAVCFPDCRTGSDCVSGGCDSEGSCLAPT